MTASRTFLALLFGAFAIAAVAERRSPKPLAPAGDVLMQIATVLPSDDGMHETVVLVPEPNYQDGGPIREFLPITVGGMEGASIALAAAGKSFVRPMTHDLMFQVLNRAGLSVRGVYIHTMQKDTFFARLELSRDDAKKGEKPLEFDCRPSDALALAVRAGAPIFVSDRVLRDAAVPLPTGHGKLAPAPGKTRPPL
jgi:uncharacterized protein